MVAGPSVLKKRKMDDKVSFLTITERKRKLTKTFFKTVELNGKKIMPPCRQCEGAGVTCYRKTHGLVLTAEDWMQRGGGKEEEGERNGGDKGETERERKQNRDGGDG